MTSAARAWWVVYGVALLLAGIYIAWAAAAGAWAGGYSEFLPRRG